MAKNSVASSFPEVFAAMFDIPKHKLFRSIMEDLEDLLQPMEVPEDDPV